VAGLPLEIRLFWGDLQVIQKGYQSAPEQPFSNERQYHEDEKEHNSIISQ
jgi:hypothetical protein